MKKIDTTFTVSESGLLLEFLLKNVLSKSKNNIKTLLKNGMVLVNGKSVTKFDYPIKKGNVISFGQAIKKSNTEDINVLFEDKDLIVIDKPAGLLSIATDKEKEKTAYSVVSDYLKQDNPNNRVFIVHRLDKETSGIMVFAKNEKTKHLFQDNWEDIATNRSYIGVVEGQVSKKEDTIKTWLKETTSQRVYSSSKENDGKEAITIYKTLKSNAHYSLLAIEIKTGRKNQIRVHMMEMGHPVVGDKKYGTGKSPIKRLALHANLLELKHPITKKKYIFESKMPASFNRLFK